MSTPLTATLDVGRLPGWFAAHGVPFAGTPQLTLIAGGRSNLTFRVADEVGHDYVLRRPPMGPLLVSAHDVVREHRIISALAGSGVPVPRSYGACDDPAVFGDAPFYLMELVPGVVLNNEPDGARYPPAARGVASRDLVEVMAAIHRVDVDAVGLGSLGKRENYCARQLRRWMRQFTDSSGAVGRDIPLVRTVHDALAATIPAQRWTGLVHGDFRPGNTLLGPDGRVNAVLDWELATLGDTLADLGWLLATWRQPGEPEVFESPTALPGWWTRDQLLEHYASVTGRDVAAAPWYRAFALWRLTCISEGIHARYAAGSMGDEDFDVAAQSDRVVALAEAAAEALPR
jgi:aminoglycoside phosphotransferase (APT) family kinase protein